MFLLIKYIFLSGLLNFLHPVHVSVSNLDINTLKKSINYSLRINREDLEYAIIHKYNTEIILNEISEEETFLIKKYLDETFKLKFKEEIVFSLNNIKTEEELIWVYFHSNLKEISDTFLIENKILLDLWPDQKNLLIFSINEVEKGYTFDFLNQKIMLLKSDFIKDNL